MTLPAADETVLSNRELTVLRLIAQGCSNQEIAEQLFISLHTVKTHARRINTKLGRSEEHTSELQSLMRISYAVFCLKQNKKEYTRNTQTTTKKNTNSQI